MNKRISKASLLVASSALALSAVPAFGQGSSDSDVEQVVVSASRISIAGYQQPTPVSVITAAALAEAANTDIGDTIRQLPSMGTGASPEKGAAGKFSGLGRAQAVHRGQGIKQRLYYRPAAMNMQFGDIFTGKAAGGRKGEGDTPVNEDARRGVKGDIRRHAR